MNPLFSLFKEKLKGKGVPALIDREEGATFISAANIYTSVVDRARTLKATGFTKGDILIDSPCGREAAINFLVCQYFDAIYYPMAPSDYETFETQESSGNKRVFTLNGLVGLKNFSFLQEDKDYALILNTSGSYQKKAVALTAEGLLFQLEGHQKFLEKFPHEHKLSLLPKFHCFGLILDLLLGLISDKYITLYEKGRLTPTSLKEVFTADDIDFISGVPKQLELLIRMAKDHPELKEILKKVTFYGGGAPINSGLEKRAKEVFKDLIIGYGLTEAGPGIMMNHLVLPRVEVKFIDNHLYFRSPSVGDYHDKITKEGWMKTNDIFSDDTPRRPLGRSDDYAKSINGLLHHSTQVEETVMKRFGVTCYILNNHHGKFAYFEEHNHIEAAQSFVKANYPEISKQIVLKDNEILPLIEKNKGKSTKDILKNVHLPKVS